MTFIPDIHPTRRQSELLISDSDIQTWKVLLKDHLGTYFNPSDHIPIELGEYLTCHLSKPEFFSLTNTIEEIQQIKQGFTSFETLADAKGFLFVVDNKFKELVAFLNAMGEKVPDMIKRIMEHEIKHEVVSCMIPRGTLFYKGRVGEYNQTNYRGYISNVLFIHKDQQ